MSVTKEDVLARLAGVAMPDGSGDIVARGLVADVFVSGGRVAFSITVPAERAREFEPVRLAAERAVSGMPGVEKAFAALTAERSPSAAAPRAPRPGGSPAAAPVRQGPGAGRAGVPGIASIIAVASGKGGVGKSTTAVNLALALQANGARVGILDADIYGPSVPKLLRLSGRPRLVSGRTLAPMDGYGLAAMSIGLLVDEDTPMIWRGPMVISAITQMLREVAWGDLDVLVVDMPPGTGDAQLTMAQSVPLAGAVIVSTPQDLALIDARKGIGMFKKVDVPILGIVENMSFFVCPHCGTRSDLFGHGGARHEAERLGVPFLGEVPLHIAIREQSDAGRPPVVAEPDGPHALIYREIAARVSAALASQKSGGRTPPRIVIES